MSQSRIEAFEAMVKENPEQPMVWYGLASEYFKLELWADASESLRNCIHHSADYTAAYQMLGTALLHIGEREAARQAWTNGIEVATRTGAWKARQHMEGLLGGLAPVADDKQNGESAFCK